MNELYIPDELRALDFPEARHFANMLVTANRLRTPRYLPPEEEMAEHLQVNSRGYTRNQSIAGGLNAGIKRNKEAMARAIGPLCHLLEAKGYAPFAEKVKLEARNYGLHEDFIKQQVIKAQQASSSKISKEAKAEEEYLWKLYCTKGTQAVLRFTVPA